MGRDHLAGRKIRLEKVHFGGADAFGVGVHHLEEDIVEAADHVDNFYHHIRWCHLGNRRHILDREDVKAVDLKDHEVDHSHLEHIHFCLDADGNVEDEPLLI